MKYSIIDDSAINFATKLYMGISNGKPLDVAITNARKELLITDDFKSFGFGNPVLFTTNPDSLILEESSETDQRSRFDSRIIINLERLGYNFIGRRREVRRIKNDFLNYGVRAVIIHGFGGIGKTATASYVSEELIKDFDFIYTFDCDDLKIERFLQELSDFLSRNGIYDLKDVLKITGSLNLQINYAVQILSNIKLLVILDNFESVLEQEESYYKIKDLELEEGLRTIINQCSEGIKFLFTSRYTFEFMKGRSKSYIDVINIGELSKIEAIMLMSKLPGIQKENLNIKKKIFDKIGGHPYTINIFSQHARRSSVKDLLESILNVNKEMIDFTLLEKTYNALTEDSKDLLQRCCVFNEPIPILGLQRLMKQDNINQELDELIHWGLISKIESGEKTLYQIHTLVNDFVKKKLNLLIG